MTGGEDALVFHARRYAQALSSENARSNYLVRLQVSADVNLVCSIARQHALTPQIALTAWLRAAELADDNVAVLLEAASALYSHGLDDAAAELIDKAITIDPQSIAAFELKAALTPDPSARREIFEQILKIDPGNRVAVDNLILMDRPK